MFQGHLHEQTERWKWQGSDLSAIEYLRSR